MKAININQKKAINTVQGPVLIIAGPGTGKTYTLVERVAHMVGDLNIDPSSIMISTFTNKAARELLDRLSIKFKELGVNKDINDMYLGNFHGICRRILEDNIEHTDFKKGFSIIDDVEKKYLIYRNLDSFKKIPGYYNLISNKDVYKIEKIVKTVFEEGILQKQSDDPKIQTVFNIVNLYEKILKSQNKMDFSGQLYYTYKLFYENSDIRNAYKKKIRYILIDEYQDTNSIQEKIIFSILNHEENICVVGDDDQGLYRFRGATVRNILHFQSKLRKKAEFIELDINYRSKKDIVDFYTRFMRGLDYFYDIEKYRFKKHLRANDDHDQKSVFRMESKTEDEYKNSIIDLIHNLKNSNKIDNFNQVAILVSSVNDPRIMKLQTALRNSGIGVYTPRTSKLINKIEAKLIIGALFAVFKPLLDSKKIQLSYDSYQFLGICHNEIYKYEQKDSGLSDFISQMSQYLMSDKVNLSLLDILYRFFRYKPFFSIFEDAGRERMQKNISRMLELIVNFCQIETLYYLNSKNIDWFCKIFFDAFIGFIRKENVPEFEEDTVIPNDDEISLLTIHASKGMEYPVVIMASLWDRPYKTYENQFDKFLDVFTEEYGKKTFEPNIYVEIFDFYRKYYTGFSRAEDLLILVGIKNEDESLVGIELKYFFEHSDSFTDECLADLTKKEAKKKDDKRIYSYTQDVVQYNFCPRAYKFFRKLKFTKTLNFGMVYGSIVHETIEYINKSVINAKVLSEEIIFNQLREIAKNKFLQGATFITKKLVDQAFEEVMRYFNQLSEFDRIIDSELAISLALDDFIITGNVDMIFEKAGSTKIIDFKTGAIPKEADKEDLLHQYVSQLHLYANLYEKTKGQKIDKLGLYFTGLKNLDHYMEFEVKDDILMENMSKITQTISAIEEDEEFEKTVDESKCKNCDLRFLCDRV